MLEPARKLASRVAPVVFTQRRRHGIAVEDRENERAQRIELPATIVAGVRAQHAFDELSHHGQPERIGTPARAIDGLDELRLLEQHLCVVTGAGARVLVDALLDTKADCSSMKSASAPTSVIGGHGRITIS